MTKKRGAKGTLLSRCVFFSSFVIRHSSFVIRHSSFVIRHSSFVIRSSSRENIRKLKAAQTYTVALQTMVLSEFGEAKDLNIIPNQRQMSTQRPHPRSRRQAHGLELRTERKYLRRQFKYAVCVARPAR
jgi:hypothetical protein